MLTADSAITVEIESPTEPQDLATPPPPPSTEVATEPAPEIEPSNEAQAAPISTPVEPPVEHKNVTEREPLPSDTFRIVTASGVYARLARELSPIVRRDVLVGAEVNVGRAVWDRVIVPHDAPEVAPPMPADWLAASLPTDPADAVAFAADAIAGRLQRPFPEGPNALRTPLLELIQHNAATLGAAVSLAANERDNTAREFLRKLRLAIVSTPGALSPADRTPQLVALLRPMLSLEAPDADFDFAARALRALDAIGEADTLAVLFLTLGWAASTGRDKTARAAATIIAHAIAPEECA